ncbi:MAG: hypothetical protein K2W95_11065 [Candidatus Obscuribacterales bacterium]|nr:hypothetical protein [Candidatus Obscuribacterales bacterium]
MSNNDNTQAELPTQRIGARVTHPGFMFTDAHLERNAASASPADSR